MSTRRKRAAKRQPAPPKKRTSDDSLAVSTRATSLKRVNIESALVECVGAICLVEVAMNSLESQEIASSEQEVLRRALKPMWFVHDWIYELRPEDDDGAAGEREDEP